MPHVIVDPGRRGGSRGVRVAAGALVPPARAAATVVSGLFVRVGAAEAGDHLVPAAGLLGVLLRLEQDVDLVVVDLLRLLARVVTRVVVQAAEPESGGLGGGRRGRGRQIGTFEIAGRGEEFARARAIASSRAHHWSSSPRRSTPSNPTPERARVALHPRVGAQGPEEHAARPRGAARPPSARSSARPARCRQKEKVTAAARSRGACATTTPRPRARVEAERREPPECADARARSDANEREPRRDATGESAIRGVPRAAFENVRAPARRSPAGDDRGGGGESVSSS